jgi:hypothetical protein
MEAEEEKTFGLDDCYSGVTFLFCFCFIISVYAPLNFPSPFFPLPSLHPSTKRLTQQKHKKIATAAVKPQRIGKIKKKNRYLQKAEGNTAA